MGEPIRVLQVLGGTNLGGAESRIMDLYRNMDRERVQFDFAVHSFQKGFFDEEIEKMGGRIYRLPRFKIYNWMAYRKAWKELFSKHKEFVCVHGHMTSTAAIYLPIAKAAGVRTTAAHARSAGVDGGIKGKVTRYIRKDLWKKTDYCLSTSALAGEAVFGREAMEKGLVRVIPNAIYAEKYEYNPEKRRQMRSELGLEHAFVAGHVGRFHPCKNHGFLLQVFEKLHEKRPEAVLLLLGEGSGMEDIRQQAAALGLADCVIFAGNRENVYDYYQAMDCFIFPSLYEGLPGTVLEAQTAGLPCLAADTITDEVGITELVRFMPLSDSPLKWAETILDMTGKERCGRIQDLQKCGFDAKLQAEKIQRFYETGRLEDL